MPAALNGAQLVLTCQRTDCTDQVIVDLGEEPWHFKLVDLVGDEEIPEGWGWDANGNDAVLHCPEHRS